jgi:hypothetical protein
VGICSCVGLVGRAVSDGAGDRKWVWLGEEGSVLWAWVVVGFVFLEGMFTCTYV